MQVLLTCTLLLLDNRVMQLILDLWILNCHIAKLLKQILMIQQLLKHLYIPDTT